MLFSSARSIPRTHIGRMSSSEYSMNMRHKNDLPFVAFLNNNNEIQWRERILWNNVLPANTTDRLYHRSKIFQMVQWRWKSNEWPLAKSTNGIHTAGFHDQKTRKRKKAHNKTLVIPHKHRICTHKHTPGTLIEWKS